MKVLKDNYHKKETTTTVVCPRCESVLEVMAKDYHISMRGCVSLRCPLCMQTWDPLDLTLWKYPSL